MIITKKEVDYIKKRSKNEPFSLMVDFGQREVEVIREEDKAIFNGLTILDLKEKIKDNFCYLLDDQGVRKITFFSEETNKFYKLVPTSDWPTIAISSVPMHRLSSPKKDTENKINLLKPFGHVLDTCMGPGYTAILAAKKAKKVITFEKDDNIYGLAKINPLSQELFSAENIEICMSDVNLGIKELEDDCFDCIIHDPPTFKLAGELFSQDFYGQLIRVLKSNRKMFHYTPLYKVKQGVDFPAQIEKRLKKAGFNGIKYSQKAVGFLCQK
ncbi:MAG: SAM-dependent methyltransferase [Candidatus Omnitrophica bacterium]|nr:SAM-dependent methyltransferase [Candidatus Omnitrophota bacterium]